MRLLSFLILGWAARSGGATDPTTDCQEESEAAFVQADTDKDKRLNFDEFLQLVRTLGLSWESSQVQLLFTRLDVKPKDEAIGVTEWVALSCGGLSSVPSTTTRDPCATTGDPCAPTIAPTPLHPSNASLALGKPWTPPVDNTPAPQKRNFMHLAGLLLRGASHLLATTTTKPIPIKATNPPIPAAQTTPLTTATTESGSSGSSSGLWVLWVFLALCLFCCLLAACAAAAAVLMRSKRKKKSKKRAVGSDDDEIDYHYDGARMMMGPGPAIPEQNPLLRQSPAQSWRAEPIILPPVIGPPITSPVATSYVTPSTPGLSFG